MNFFLILYQTTDQRILYSEELKDFTEQLQGWQSVKFVMKPAGCGLCYDGPNVVLAVSPP